MGLRMPTLSPDTMAIILPLSILFAASLLFGIGLVWARFRDRQMQVCLQLECSAQAILDQIEPWAGSQAAAWEWYQTYPIAPLGGQTAEQLVAQGRTHEVMVYLAHIRQGGYA